MKSRFLRNVAVRWTKFRRFMWVQCIRADDPPHKLALGIALGIFWGMLPMIGQTVAVVASAWILRANRLVGVGLVWISNPLTYA
ncbi:MAG: DUF2062 domain-containing protein, partial [Planctomycetota bacterium]